MTSRKMAQLTVYVDGQTFKKITLAAKKEHVSISRWVKSRLSKSLTDTWPEHYFELFGAASDCTFERPDQGSFEQDIPRAKL